MQRSTDGSPAYSDRRASLWQYWQSILYVPACTLWGKLMGWLEGFAAAAGWGVPHHTPRENKKAKSAPPRAAPPPLAPIHQRTFPRGFGPPPRRPTPGPRPP